MTIDLAVPRSALLGSTVPRIFTRPLVTGRRGRCGCGCALTGKTSLGFAAVKFAEERLGFPLIPWQRWLLIHALELRPDGRFRYRTLVVVMGRQNGKTTVVKIKNLWKMYEIPRIEVIGTAQDLDTAEETLGEAIELVEEDEDLGGEISFLNKTNGKKALVLTNRSRWKVKAASRRGGRGLKGDDINLDELREHQNWEAWAAVTKTTLARSNPQVWGFSSAGDRTSVVLNALTLKGRGLAAAQIPADATFGWFEWSAPDHIKCTCIRIDGEPHEPECVMWDRAAWAAANPSLGYTITEEALMSSMSTDPTAVFLTECLGRQVDDRTEGRITAAAWAKLADPDSRRAGDIALGVDISPLRDSAAITVFGERVDGLGHAQLIDYRPGATWVVDRLAELCAALDPVAVGIGRGTFASLETDLAAIGLHPPADADKPGRGDLAIAGGGDMAAACSQIIDAVTESTFRYVPATQLDESVAGAKTRSRGDSVAWARTDAGTDTSPLVSLTLARWAFLMRRGVAAETEYDPLDYIH